MKKFENKYGIPTLPFEMFAASIEPYPDRLEEYFNLGQRRPLMYHNKVTMLTCLFLMVVCGVRFTRSPFCFLSRLVNADISLLFAEDKNISGFHARRIVVLPSCAAYVLARYAQHISNLVRVLARSPIQNTELASRFQTLITPGITREEQPIPYFCLLEDNRNVVVLGKKIFKRELSDMINYRLKEFRPQLCQFLIQAGAPRHLVAFQMGHMKAFRPAFSARNQITPIDFAYYMQPFLDMYARRLGWCHE